MTNLHDIVEGILQHPDDTFRQLVLADWLDDHGDDGRSGWLRFAHQLSASKWPVSKEIGFINNYALALQRLSSRRGGPQLGWIGRLASWDTVQTNYGVSVADLLEQPELRNIQERRLQLCGIEVPLIGTPTITQLLGGANDAARTIFADRVYMESAARFFDSILLPRSVPTSPI